MRGIQYTAASRFHRWRLGSAGSSGRRRAEATPSFGRLCRTMTVGSAAHCRAMTHMRNRSAARIAPEILPETFALLETRARGMPGAQCTRSPVCAMGVKYAHRYSQRRHRKTSGIPHAMVYGFLRALPGDHRFVDPVIRATRWRHANLTPASGRQNHTASPSATRSARLTPRCVHRIPPHVHDDRDTPLHRGGMARPVAYISEKRKQNIFRVGAGQEFADAARRANQLDELF